MKLAFDEGFIFAERYRILRPIASGGMGAVYEAKHLVTGRRCAIKVMLGHTLDQAELRARFLQEARLAAQIRSSHVVDVLDAGIEESHNAPFLVMELLEGEDLAQRLVRRGALASEDAVTCLWHVAIALDKMHRAGVVHRDLKPRNLFITKSDNGSPLIKVLDFGVAKSVRREASMQGTQNIGTPLYMAPEQFLADGRVSPATDIYGLGMITYTLLVGAHYWKEEHAVSENPFAFSRFVSDGPVEPANMRAARQNVELPASFDAWFARACAAIPTNRFKTAHEAVTELALVLDVPAPLMDPDEITGHPSDGPDEPRLELLNPMLEAALAATGTGHSAVRNMDPATAPDLGLRRISGARRVDFGARDAEFTEASLSVTSGVGTKGSKSGRRWLFALLTLFAASATAGGFIWWEGRSKVKSASLPDPAAVVPPQGTSAPAEPKSSETARASSKDLETEETRPISASELPLVEANAGASALPSAQPPAVQRGGRGRDSRRRLYTRD